MTRKGILGVAALALLLLPGCFSYKPVELVGVRTVKVDKLDLKGIKASVAVEVNNPNGYRIRVMDPDLFISVNGIGVGKAKLDSTVVLARGTSGVYHVPLRVDFQLEQAGLLPGLAAALFTRSVKLGVKGTVVGKAGLVRKRFPFSDERTIDLR